MTNNDILQAIKHNICTRYVVEEMLDEVEHEDEFCRIEFDMALTFAQHQLRTKKYIDIAIFIDCIIVFAQSRTSIRVDYRRPDAIDQVYSFIESECQPTLKV